MKDKFLAKCKHCKRYNGGNCTISDFEDRSCAFVYEHLMSEGIGDCDVFEKEKDKRYIVGISLWVYAVDIIKIKEKQWHSKL